jgi:hypothetical protein
LGKRIAKEPHRSTSINIGDDGVVISCVIGEELPPMATISSNGTEVRIGAETENKAFNVVFNILDTMLKIN